MCVNAALATSLSGCVPSTTSVNLSQGVEPRDTKQVFRELGRCSRTFFYILNREFGHQNEIAEIAAIWLNSLAWCREQNRSNPEEKVTSAFGNPKANATLKAFLEVTGSKIRCDQISGQRFKTLEDHSKYIENRGCRYLINALVET